ncbi:MAG TPA: acyl carrier protein [Reyranella sp.]|nr:acyl carrier protein [Reyranella sp.]
MSEQSLQKVIALVAEVLNVPAVKVNVGSSIETLQEWDSEAHMEICLAFEARFGAPLDMDTIGEVTSVRALADLLDKGKG